MASMFVTIYETYNDILENHSDPRVKDWLMMSGPGPTILSCLIYALFVTKIGPKLMEDRKPFELRKTIQVYNAFQVIFSIWLFREACHAGWFSTYSFRCQPVDYSNDPHALRTACGCWWYYMSKFSEFFDTVSLHHFLYFNVFDFLPRGASAGIYNLIIIVTIFFVLRKKNNQITRLHVIHHGIMPMSTWLGVKFTPGGHSTFFGLLNTFVHIIMYSYYFAASFGPKVQKYLWWKRYLTALQMVQFILVMIHAFQLLFIECDYPRAFVWLIGLHAVMFYFLFKDFYNQAYIKKNKDLEARRKKDDDSSSPVANGRKDETIMKNCDTPVYQSPGNGHTVQNGYTTSDARHRAYVKQ